MAKVSIDDARKASTNGNFFSLKNDKEEASVRFLYGHTDEVDIYSVHEVKLGDRRRLVDCLKDPSDPDSHCPFCDAGIKKQQKVFLLLLDEKTDEVKLWERTFLGYERNILPILEHVSSDEIVGTCFTIIRNGKPGDMKTTYTLMVSGVDETSMKDFGGELPATDTSILKKTAEEMEAYIETGNFPQEEAEQEEEQPVRKSAFKKSSAREVPAEEAKAGVKRRSRF